jgi:hypothetical protein
LMAGDGSAFEGAAAADAAQPVIVKPLEMGLVLNRADALGASDANANAKRVRLRELLLISEWFRLPVLAADPAAATAALPADLRNILTRPIMALANRPANVKQLAVFGGHAGAREAAATLRQGGTDVFLVTDALIGGTHASLEPAYVEGAIPTTYKSLYYELTRSVSDAEWPSPQWVTDAERYFDRTQAPEDLPPIGEPQ